MNDHGTADDSPPAYDDSKALLLLSTSNLEMPPPVSSAIWSANDTVRSSTSGCILRRWPQQPIRQQLSQQRQVIRATCVHN